ncbi:MAG: hypothetical protein IKD13_05580, partial [Firmicutes bacterium]|nr:hypothetical protein [Bacillota bacterium]
MATKLKNTNKKLLQMMLIPLCAALFVGTLHFGIKALYTAGRSNFSERMLTGESYIESGEIVSEMRWDFQTVMSRSYSGINYYSDPNERIFELGEQDRVKINTKAELREVFWKQMTENLDGIEDYSLLEDRVFHVKLGDRIYKSSNYQDLSSHIAASITITANDSVAGG